MDVEYFPFDEQTCVMKFGSWTYDGFQVKQSLRERVTGFVVHPVLSVQANVVSPVYDIGSPQTLFT